MTLSYGDCVSFLQSPSFVRSSPERLRMPFSHFIITIMKRPGRRRHLGYASAAVRQSGQSGLPGIISTQFPPLEGVLASACTQNWTGRKVLESSLLFPLSGCVRAVRLLALSAQCRGCPPGGWLKRPGWDGASPFTGGSKRVSCTLTVCPQLPWVRVCCSIL